MLWSTVSKAAFRSRRASSAILPDSTADIRSDNRRSKAVSVEWKRRYADWLLDINLLLSRYFARRDKTTFSRVFEMKGRADISHRLASDGISRCVAGETNICFKAWTLLLRKQRQLLVLRLPSRRRQRHDGSADISHPLAGDDISRYVAEDTDCLFDTENFSASKAATIVGTTTSVATPTEARRECRRDRSFW